MEKTIIKWGLLVISICYLIGCGPKQVSALGNIGDLCTEERSCPPGTECRLVGETYRCVKVKIVRKNR